MEFIFDCSETNLTPEKIEDVYYDDFMDYDWMITFNSVSDMVLFVNQYGACEILPAEDENSLPTFRVLGENN